MSSAKPKDKTFAELETILKAHFEPKALVIAERFRFYRQDQAAEETIAEFVAALRKLATNRNFGDSLSDALHDRLVCGLRDEEAQGKKHAIVVVGTIQTELL